MWEICQCKPLNISPLRALRSAVSLASWARVFNLPKNWPQEQQEGESRKALSWGAVSISRHHCDSLRKMLSGEKRTPISPWHLMPLNFPATASQASFTGCDVNDCPRLGTASLCPAVGTSPHLPFDWVLFCSVAAGRLHRGITQAKHKFSKQESLSKFPSR